jgi:uncharacterized phage-associated protein
LALPRIEEQKYKNDLKFGLFRISLYLCGKNDIGMKKFSEDSKRKLGHAILYLACHVEDLSKSKLIKLLYLMEEAMVRKYQYPFLALQYEVWQYGPVAKEIYVGFTNTPTILHEYVYTSATEDGTYIYPNTDFDAGEFSEMEMDVMTSVVRDYGQMKARELKDITHRPDGLWYKIAQAKGLLDAFDRQECTSSDEVIDFSELLPADEKPVYMKRLNEVEAVNDLKIDFQDYQRYQRGWDGEDGLPLTQQVIRNFSQVLSVADNETLSAIRIYPDDNGSLGIELKGLKAGLSLGNDAFSHYMIDNDHVIGDSHVPFSPQAVADVIASFHR